MKYIITNHPEQLSIIGGLTLVDDVLIQLDEWAQSSFGNRWEREGIAGDDLIRYIVTTDRADLLFWFMDYTKFLFREQPVVTAYITQVYTEEVD